MHRSKKKKKLQFPQLEKHPQSEVFHSPGTLGCIWTLGCCMVLLDLDSSHKYHLFGGVNFVGFILPLLAYI